jgi:hypothetical protein
VTSRYLLNSPRTLRQACRDICLAHPDSPAKDCHICILGDLCVINEENEHEEEPVQRGTDYRKFLRGAVGR